MIQWGCIWRNLNQNSILTLQGSHIIICGFTYLLTIVPENQHYNQENR